MRDEPLEIKNEPSEPVDDKQVDQHRRKFGSAGVAGTGVLLSMASKSAMGGWGTCSGSELASSGLSRTGEANPCGCSPGYWWNSNGTVTWDNFITANPLHSGYSRTALFNTVFGVPYFNSTDNVQLGMLNPSSNFPPAFVIDGSNYEGIKNVAMHAVAALLNAAFYGLRYPAPYKTPSAVINAFALAFNSTNRRQALKAFVEQVDVYTSSNTWCDGKPHGGVP